MSLAIDYRPHRFAEVVGQQHIKPILQAMVKTGNVAACMSFVGTRGTGKTSAGRILAAALNCPNQQKGDACAKCDSCVSIQNGESFAVLEVDAASNGTVDDIRALRETVGYAHEGEWRVIMLDEAHSMSPAAFNALLKVLEEPPPKTVFLLLTTEENKILPTVASRSMTFEFRRLSHSDIVGRLAEISKERKLGAKPDLFDEIEKRAQGGMRDAVMLLDQVSRVGTKDAASFRELFGIRDVSFALLSAASRQDFGTGVAVIDDYFHHTGDASGMVSDLVRLVRDLFVIQASNEEPDDERGELARVLPTDKLIGVMRVLWDLRARVRAVDNDQRSAMHMAFALIVDALQDRRVQTPITQGANGAAERRLTLDEMKGLVEQIGKGL